MRSWILLCAGVLSGVAGCVDRDLKRGDDALGMGRHDEAIAAYTAARARLPPADPTPTERLAAAHRAKAMAALAADQCVDAHAHFDVAAGLSEPVLADYQQVDECQDRTHAELATRITEHRHLLELGDKRPQVRLDLMRMELAIGEPEAALAHLPAIGGLLDARDKAIVLRTMLDLGRHDDAYPLLVEHAMRHPDDPLVNLKLAELSEERGELKRARSVYADLARAFPQNPVVHLRQAAFLRRQGDLNGAARAEAEADALRGIRYEDRELRPLQKSRR